MEKKIQNKRIRKGDKVIVRSGNDRGEVGTILSRDDDYAVVQGINVCKKHVKKSQMNPNGGVVSIERKVHVSKLQAVGKDDKPVKLRVSIDKNGERSIYYRDGNEQVTVRSVKSK